MDWEPYDADVRAFAECVRRWENRAYAAIITAVVASLGCTALAGALTTVPA